MVEESQQTEERKPGNKMYSVQFCIIIIIIDHNTIFTQTICMCTYSTINVDQKLCSGTDSGPGVLYLLFTAGGRAVWLTLTDNGLGHVFASARVRHKQSIMHNDHRNLMSPTGLSIHMIRLGF